MRNFYIINTRLKKLDEINDLDLKIKGLEKELKFLSMKTETIAEKIPQEGSTLTKTDVKMISKEQIYEVLNSRD
jgi:ribosomal protein L9